MGHMYPEFYKGLLADDWVLYKFMAGFSDIKIPKFDFSDNDVILFIGAHHPPEELIPDVGNAKLAYVSLRNDRVLSERSHTEWIDPLWDWHEGSVRIKNYDIPVLANSGIINASISMDILDLYK